jgi:hypothetical protein
VFGSVGVCVDYQRDLEELWMRILEILMESRFLVLWMLAVCPFLISGKLPNLTDSAKCNNPVIDIEIQRSQTRTSSTN